MDIGLGRHIFSLIHLIPIITYIYTTNINEIYINTCPAGHSQPGLQFGSHTSVFCNIISVHVWRHDNVHVLNISPSIRHTPRY